MNAGKFIAKQLRDVFADVRWMLLVNGRVKVTSQISS